MFAPKRWRKRRYRTELVAGGRVEMVFTEPTYDDLKAFFDEIDYEVQIQEERAENRVDTNKMKKVSFVQKVPLSTEGSKK